MAAGTSYCGITTVGIGTKNVFNLVAWLFYFVGVGQLPMAPPGGNTTGWGQIFPTGRS